MPERESFGELLRSYRVMAAMTQQELAELSTVSIRAIRDLEQGHSRWPRRATVRLLADGLRLTGRKRAEFEAAASRMRSKERWSITANALGYQVPPAPGDQFFDRRAELALLDDLLEDASTRLVVVTGVGGIGKTRLVAEWARTKWELGVVPVWWTQATDLDTADFANTLLDTTAVVVLDGADHSVAAEVMSLLGSCPKIKLVVTARTPLGIQDEYVVPVGPLSTMPNIDATDTDVLAALPAVELLARHIRQLDPTFTVDARDVVTFARIVQVLDAHPAALIQAATWCTLRSPRDFLADLSHDLEALRLAAHTNEDVVHTIVSSTEFLTECENYLLARLADAPASWTVEEALAATRATRTDIAGLIQRLLLAGIIRRETSADQPRFVIFAPLRSQLAHQQLTVACFA
ncbi:XRE family transcriptional regulator [Saccharomonospora azurea SZMC 14600]|uniref:helix-turn-helix domain-containing protein n=1 Tax=Saccharomonospora azurea TaxID=40988 RepID=UPI00024000C8|nr:AAA family ATPase [Saccharomonospora azurea]EHK89322.1 XRE family transcriptional regulator [Saccharomonospora azurea SZMC 14600]